MDTTAVDSTRLRPLQPPVLSKANAKARVTRLLHTMRARDLAQRLNVSPATIYNWRQGRTGMSQGALDRLLVIEGSYGYETHGDGAGLLLGAVNSAENIDVAIVAWNEARTAWVLACKHLADAHARLVTAVTTK